METLIITRINMRFAILSSIAALAVLASAGDGVYKHGVAAPYYKDGFRLPYYWDGHVYKDKHVYWDGYVYKDGHVYWDGHKYIFKAPYTFKKEYA